jgi:hypothetical protein
MKSYYWSKLGIVLGVLSWLLRSVLPAEWIEKVYSQGLFLVLRSLIDLLVGSWLPVASIYLLIAYGVYRLWLSWRRQGMRTWTWQAWLWRSLGFIGYTVFLFLWLWGYNYGRVSVATHLELPEEKLSLAEVQRRVKSEASVLQELREQIADTDTLPLSEGRFPANMETQLREALELTLLRYYYPVAGRVRCRVLWPRGIFLRFGSAGLYFPWTGEGHIDAGLIGLQRPYTMTHELAHGYGFADEGTCSFWAYVTAFEVDDPVLKYALRLGYWRSLAGVWVRNDPETYELFRSELAAGIRADLDAINANLLAYPDLVPGFRYAAYDAYLKAQGIDEGMLNYGRVVALVEAWRSKYESDYLPVRPR